MGDGKAKFAKLFAEAKKVTLKTQTGSGITVHVFVGDVSEDTVEKERKAALNRGDMILNDDGSKEFISTTADFVDSDYVWAEDGDRVCCSRKHVVIPKDGERQETFLRHVWRNYDNV